MLIPLAVAALLLSARAPRAHASIPVAGSLHAAIESAARRIGVPADDLHRVIAVESSGKPFGPDGRLLVRFEPHVFARLTKKAGREHIVMHPGMSSLSNPRQRAKGQTVEWSTLEKAMQLDPELALRATSFGMAQIMGGNHKAVGYPSAKAMFEAFARSSTAQVDGMANYIAAHPALLQALRTRDWPRFVAIYNGAPVGTKNNAAYVAKLRQERKTAMSGLSVLPYRIPPSRKLIVGVRDDRRVLLRKARQARLRAWMHSPAFRAAQQANERLAKAFGWSVRGPFKTAGDPALAVLLFRIAQAKRLPPSGRMTSAMLRVLQQEIARGSRIGKWTSRVLRLPSLSGIGAEPGFLARLGKGAMEHAENVAAEKKRVAQERSADEREARRVGMIESAKAQARAKWGTARTPNLPVPGRGPTREAVERRRASVTHYRTKRFLPWIIGGVGGLLALFLLLRKPAVAPAPAVITAI